MNRQRCPYNPGDGAMLVALALQWLAPATRLRAFVLRVHELSAELLDALDLVLDRSTTAREDTP